VKYVENTESRNDVVRVTHHEETLHLYMHMSSLSFLTEREDVPIAFQFFLYSPQQIPAILCTNSAT
jgi:hypothetical protein